MPLLWRLALVVWLAPGVFSQTTTTLPPKPAAGSPERVIDSVFAYLNMASTVGRTATFQSLTQAERNRLSVKLLTSSNAFIHADCNAMETLRRETPNR